MRDLIDLHALGYTANILICNFEVILLKTSFYEKVLVRL